MPHDPCPTTHDPLALLQLTFQRLQHSVSGSSEWIVVLGGRLGRQHGGGFAHALLLSRRGAPGDDREQDDDEDAERGHGGGEPASVGPAEQIQDADRSACGTDPGLNERPHVRDRRAPACG